MKKTCGLLAGLLIAVVFPTVVNAAEASFDMTCDPLEAARNGEVECTLKIASTDGQPFSSVSAEVTVPAQMTFDGVYTTNTNIWTNVSNGSNLKFNLAGSPAVFSPSDIAVFKVRVNADATECGEVCVQNLTYDGKAGITAPICQTIRLQNQGTVIPDTPIINDPIDNNSSTATEDNPQTGSFVPYVVISGAALLAIGAIVVASKKSKFYNI